MKAAILILLLTRAISLQAFSADEPLIPATLNTLLPKVKAGMTISQVESVLSVSYTNVTSQVADSTYYMTGYVSYKLDDRYTLSVRFLNVGTGRKITPLVDQNMLFYIYDGQTRHRVGIMQN
jgi:hypothetical protein